MNSQPEIKNGIKPFIDYEHRPCWDELRQGGAVLELTAYILEKNKTRNKSTGVAADLAVALIRKSLPISFKFFPEVIKRSTEEELQEIIENVNLSPNVNLTEQLMVATAGHYGIKGKQRSIDFFTWVDLSSVSGYQFLSKLRQNPKSFKIETLWQFNNLIHGLNIGPNLGYKLSKHELYCLNRFPHLDFSYLEDYKFPEPFLFNMEMFIKAGGTHECIINKTKNILRGLTRREYFEFWDSELKFLPFLCIYEYDVKNLLKEYLFDKLRGEVRICVNVEKNLGV